MASTFNQASRHRHGDGLDGVFGPGRQLNDAYKEPILSAPARHPAQCRPQRRRSQTRWGASRTDDLEEQCEDGSGDDEARL
jgi:hypothetical protein